jgi:hypothetical protein
MFSGRPREVSVEGLDRRANAELQGQSSDPQSSVIFYIFLLGMRALSGFFIFILFHIVGAGVS